MHISREQLTPTTVKLTVEVDEAILSVAKADILKRLSRQMKVPGFRTGKIPAAIVERNADPNTVQSEVLDAALNQAYSKALEQEKLRPVDQPKVSLTKYVPYTTLSFTAEVPVIGDVTLPDYKTMHVTKKDVTIADKDVDEVLHNLQVQTATKAAVERAAKDGDEVVIAFKGVDEKTKEPVKGAEGKDYPLLLGSNTFIPGFETNVVGMKVGEEKTFTLTFPKDYGIKALQDRKVAFTVTVATVNEVALPDLDDAFAAKVGPFKTMPALREDIQKHLQAEKQGEADRAYQNEVIDMLAAKTTVAIPDVLIDEEVQRMENEVRQNLAYRGQTWQEYLAELEQDEAAYRASLREPAETRVRAGLALTEVAEREGITVTPEEFQIRMQLLKGQYTDKTMQAELEKPSSARSVMSTILTEKTVERLVEYASKASTTKAKK